MLYRAAVFLSFLVVTPVEAQERFRPSISPHISLPEIEPGIQSLPSLDLPSISEPSYSIPSQPSLIAPSRNPIVPPNPPWLQTGATQLDRELLLRCRIVKNRVDLLTPVELQTIIKLWKEQIRVWHSQRVVGSDSTKLLTEVAGTCIRALPEPSRSQLSDKLHETGIILAVAGPGAPPPTSDLPSNNPTSQNPSGSDSLLRLFPWPPPIATTSTTYTYSDLSKRAKFKTIGDIDEWLGRELKSANYFESKYWSVPGGFALVTRLEVIDDDARPVNKNRFIEPAGGHSLWDYGWSLVDYLVALTSAPARRARVFLFALTDDDRAQRQTVNVTTDYARGWLQGGTHSLSGLKDLDPHLPLTEKHVLMVLVYEFVKDTNQDPRVELRNGRPIERHLYWSGIKLTDRLQ
jgi:hypothetical protein